MNGIDCQIRVPPSRKVILKCPIQVRHQTLGPCNSMFNISSSNSTNNSTWWYYPVQSVGRLNMLSSIVARALLGFTVIPCWRRSGSHSIWLSTKFMWSYCSFEVVALHRHLKLLLHLQWRRCWHLSPRSWQWPGWWRHGCWTCLDVGAMIVLISLEGKRPIKIVGCTACVTCRSLPKHTLKPFKTLIHLIRPVMPLRFPRRCHEKSFAAPVMLAGWRHMARSSSS